MAQMNYQFNDCEAGVAYKAVFSIPKAGANTFALNTDWTPSAGDTKISQGGGSAANTTNNPSHLYNGMWALSLTATEMTPASSNAKNTIIVTVADSGDIDSVCLILNTSQRKWALERSCVYNS